MEKIFSILILVIIGLLFVGGISTCVMQDTKVSYITGQVTSVESRISSNADGKMETIHTILFLHENGEQELLESRDNLLMGKFNNMELIQQLKNMTGKKLTLKVSGFKKSFFFDYRNIISVKKIYL